MRGRRGEGGISPSRCVPRRVWCCLARPRSAFASMSATLPASRCPAHVQPLHDRTVTHPRLRFFLRLPESRPLRKIHFMVPLILLVASFLSGCEEAGVAPPPNPPSSPYAVYTPSSPGGPSEVVEKSVGYLDGPRTIYHEIGPMETIWRISRLYDVSPESIYSANGLKPGDPLLIGRKLIIPNARMIRHVINLYRNPQWKYIILHHTATGKGNARTIQSSHWQRGFWNGLGYHFLIDNGTLGKGDGQIEMSPRWIKQQEGAHCKAGEMNDKAIGIALVGNFNYERPTRNQLQSLTFLLSVLCNYYHIPPPNILAHDEVPGARTECPGKLFPMNYLRQEARSRN